MSIHNLKAVFISLMILFASVAGFNFLVPQNGVALSGSDFKPGRIMDDGVFFRGGDMSVSQIQSFLNSKVPTCDTNGDKIYSGTTTRKQYAASKGVSTPFICLKSYKTNTPAKTDVIGLCEDTFSQSNISAAQIIYNVSVACDVSAKALIVLLEKEQSLITDDWPWPIQYRSATGYGCPDTAPCDSEYYGFFNQVYHAARQYQRYAAYPNDFNYRAGFVNEVSWHPDESRCGGSTFLIENNTTAGLYNYTPYRPNSAALNNLYGTGNSCSSYGNRNFWRIFNDWFGSTNQVLNYRLVECSGQKYLIERNIRAKRTLTSSTISEWGFQESEFVSEDMGCTYPTFTLPLGEIIQSRATGKKYLLNNTNFYLVQSSTIANAWNIEDEYNAPKGDIPQLDGKTINNLTVKKYLPRLARSANTLKVYLLNNGQIHHVSGTPSDQTYLRLVRGYDEVPISNFSGDFLSGLKAKNGEGAPIKTTFKTIEGKTFIFDHGKVRQINPEYLPNRWNELGQIANGPVLVSELPGIIGLAKKFDKGFQRNGIYYVVRLGGTIESSTSTAKAKSWDLLESPNVTDLLKRIILNSEAL